MQEDHIFDELMSISFDTTQNHFNSYFYCKFRSILSNHIYLHQDATLEQFNDFVVNNKYSIQSWIWFLELMRGVTTDFPVVTKQVFIDLYIEVCKFFIKKLETIDEKAEYEWWTKQSMMHFILADLYYQRCRGEEAENLSCRDNYILAIINKKIVRDRMKWVADFSKALFCLLLIFISMAIYNIFPKESLVDLGYSTVFIVIQLLFNITLFSLMLRLAKNTAISIEHWKEDIALHRKLKLEYSIDPQLKSIDLRGRCGEFQERFSYLQYLDLNLLRRLLNFCIKLRVKAWQSMLG